MIHVFYSVISVTSYFLPMPSRKYHCRRWLFGWVPNPTKPLASIKKNLVELCNHRLILVVFCYYIRSLPFVPGSRATHSLPICTGWRTQITMTCRMHVFLKRSVFQLRVSTKYQFYMILLSIKLRICTFYGVKKSKWTQETLQNISYPLSQVITSSLR